MGTLVFPGSAVAGAGAAVTVVALPPAVGAILIGAFIEHKTRKIEEEADAYVAAREEEMADMRLKVLHARAQAAFRAAEARKKEEGILVTEEEQDSPYLQQSLRDGRDSIWKAKHDEWLRGRRLLEPHPGDAEIPSDNYRGRYNAALRAAGHPQLPGNWDVHHSIPQQLRGDPRLAGIDLDSPENLRGVPGYRIPGEETNVHTKLDQAWKGFFKRFPDASRENILNFRDYLDWRFGQQFWENRNPEK